MEKTVLGDNLNKGTSNELVLGSGVWVSVCVCVCWGGGGGWG